jgi:hypothetical protein
MSRGSGWYSCYYHWAEREKRVLSVLRRDMAGFVLGVGECLGRVLEESVAQDVLTYIILGNLFG